MMSFRILVTYILLGVAVVLVATEEKTFSRKARTFGLLSWMFGRNCGGPGDCPPHHCSRDDAVLLGWCCGCAEYGDHVPLSCPPGLACPPHIAAVCHDYNYMMDCCC